MPEENEGTPSEEQEDVLNISDEDFEAILARENSNADSTDTGDQDTGDTGSQGEGDGKADVDLARDVAGAVKSGMAEVLDAVKNAQPQPGVQPGQPVTDPMKALEDHVTKQIQGSQGLSEDGARFMAQSVMSGLNPVVQAFQAQVKQMQGTIEGLRSDTVISDLDRDINGWMDGHGIRDESDREDIREMAKVRVARDKGDDANRADVRAEVARLSNKFVTKQVSDENQDTEDLKERESNTPPPGGEGLSGQDDLVAAVTRSKSPDDDIGGKRFTRLVESMLAGGG